MTVPAVAGVDGAPGGWVAALVDEDCGFRLHRLERLKGVLELEPAMVGLDMPVGLLDKAQPGGRECDRAARKLLGSKAGSVFSPPCRPALAAGSDYRQALELNRASHGVGLSKQCHNLFPKLREVDELLTPELQGVIREVHPELAFACMVGGRPCAYSKKQAAGREERLERLAGQGFARPALEESVSLASRKALGAAADDILDALACAWSARRVLRGMALRLPESPPRDGAGLYMEILA